MSFEKIKENTEDLKENTKNYIESSLEYYKLWVFKIVTKSATLFLKIIMLSLVFVMFLFFISTAAAFAIGNSLGNIAYGFLIVGGIYLLIGGVIYLFRDSIVEKSIIGKFSDLFFND